MVVKINGQSHKLEEASRQDLLIRSRRNKPRFSKRLNYQVTNFRGVDLDKLFNNDYFVFTTPINQYVCTLAFPGVLTTLKDVVKTTNGNPGRINLQMVIRAIRRAFDIADDIRVRCTCADFQYRFMYYAWKGDYLYGEPVSGTEAPPDITNPDNNLGATCKHLDLFLSNKRWLTKAASVVNALIKTYPDKAALYLYDKEDIEEPEEDEVEIDKTEVETSEEIPQSDESPEESEETSENPEESEETN